MDYLTIGSTPVDEECTPTNPDDPGYYMKQRKEARAFKHQLERLFPKGMFKIKTFPHDFGSYTEVVAYFNKENMDSEWAKAAFEAEANMPEKWDEEALKELKSEEDTNHRPTT